MKKKPSGFRMELILFPVSMVRGRRLLLKPLALLFLIICRIVPDSLFVTVKKAEKFRFYWKQRMNVSIVLFANLTRPVKVLNGRYTMNRQMPALMNCTGRRMSRVGLKKTLELMQTTG